MKKLLFVVAEDWYFVSHRLPLAVAAIEAGYEVLVATRVNAHRERIESAGVRIISLGLVRGSFNPFREILAILELVRLYWRERPDIVHHVAIKPVLYGSLVAWLLGIPFIINAITGLGHIFISKSPSMKALKFLVKICFQFFLTRKNTITIVQNPEDLLFLQNLNIGSENSRLIRGAGVDLEFFSAQSEPNNATCTVLLPARILREKGVVEFVLAARRLKKIGIKARFILAGDLDPENPSSISREELQAWCKEGVIEHYGWCSDMVSLYAKSDIVCLPSYREGLPKALLEAAACSRVIVTTDVPGCREVVKHGINGLLVPAADVGSLVLAIQALIEKPELRKSMGEAGRLIVEREFSLEKVVAETLDVYKIAVATEASRVLKNL